MFVPKPSEDGMYKYSIKQDSSNMIRDKNILIKGDTFELLGKIPNESIDLVFTDPPYLISEHDKIFRDYRSGKRGDIRMDFGEWDYSFDMRTFLEEAYRVLVPQGSLVVWCAEQQVGDYRNMGKEIGFNPKKMLIWRKNNPPTQFRKTGYRQSIEIMFWMMKGENSRSNPNFIFGTQQEMLDVFDHPVVAGKERLFYVNEKGEKVRHPTQKPLKVCRSIIKTHCKVDGVVLDPFFGTATIPVAAKLEGRKFIGMEKDDKWFDIGNKRMEGVYEEVKKNGEHN